ncbi:MAG: DUF2808 domain-containing protein [Cyanobacteria bacterium SBLK]|nr:DUF2808 domain-containing protein [Cyanobacteria bacterium SBLK]
MVLSQLSQLSKRLVKFPSLRFPSWRLFSSLAALGVLSAGIPAATFAQSNPGLVIFSGVGNRSNILNYHLKDGRRNVRDDRYRLRIPANKVDNGVSRLIVSYPDYYEGRFRLDRIEVGYGERYRNKVEVAYADIQEECYAIENQRGRRDLYHCLNISLETPIEPETPIEIKLSQVRNPWQGGTFYFGAHAVTCLDRDREQPDSSCFSDPENSPTVGRLDTPFRDPRRIQIADIGVWILTID